jgi:hypothetical protein
MDHILTKDIFNRDVARFKSGLLKRVKLEDAHFERIFEIFSSSQVEARYLLNTSFMQRLEDVRKTFGTSGQCLEANFCENELLISIGYRSNLYKSGSIFESVTFIDDCRAVIKEMNIIFSINDELRLDTETGL